MGIERVRLCLPQIYELAQGGTAVGTGLNAHPKFGDLAAQKFSDETGFKFRSAENKFAALSAHDALVQTSAALRTLAGAIGPTAGTVTVLAEGRVLAQGTLDQVQADERVIEVYLGR